MLLPPLPDSFFRYSYAALRYFIFSRALYMPLRVDIDMATWRYTLQRVIVDSV